MSESGSTAEVTILESDFRFAEQPNSDAGTVDLSRRKTVIGSTTFARQATAISICSKAPADRGRTQFLISKSSPLMPSSSRCRRSYLLEAAYLLAI